MNHTKEKEVENPLGIAPVGGLIRKFAVPAIISMLVSAMYNIVDQIFIGQGVGMLGNAATNVAFPVTTIATALALLLGIGGASNYNLEMGAGHEKKASSIAGTALSSLVILGTILAIIVLVFLQPLLSLFGATKDVMPYAVDYLGITAVGLPFYVLSVGGNHLVRADRSPTYSMTCVLTGAIINTILDPLFIFGFGWGIKGAAWATVIGQIVSGILVIIYFAKLRKMYLDRSMLKPSLGCLGAIISLGMASCINQIAMAVVQIVMNNILRYYGGLSVYGSDIPIACVGVISKVNMVFMAICIGISQGCQPIWGFNYGARKYDRVRLAILIGNFNPAWDAANTGDEEFFQAVSVAGMILENKFERYRGNQRADRRIEEILEAHEKAMAAGDKPKSERQILVLPEFVPCQKRLSETAIAFVIFPSNRGGYCIQPQKKEYSLNYKCNFPAEWLGLENEELAAATGLKSASFCHKGGFLMSVGTLEDAVNACLISLQEFHEESVVVSFGGSVETDELLAQLLKLKPAKVVHLDFPELPEMEIQGVFGEILMEKQDWKKAVKEQVKQILRYKPEAVFVGNSLFSAYPVVHMLRKKHIPVLTVVEKDGQKLLVRIPSGS